MFQHTKAAVLKIWGDFKRISFVCNICTQILTLSYLIYALISQTGLWYINTFLLALSLAYTVFFLCTHQREKRNVKKIGKKIYKWIKRITKLYPMIVTVYGLFLSVNHLTPLALILPILTIAAWVLDVLIEIICMVIQSRLDYLFIGLVEDTKNIPLLGRWTKNITGKYEDDENEENPVREYLRAQAALERERIEQAEGKKAKKSILRKLFSRKKSIQRIPAPMELENTAKDELALTNGKK